MEDWAEDSSAVFLGFLESFGLFVTVADNCAEVSVLLSNLLRDVTDAEQKDDEFVENSSTALLTLPRGMMEATSVALEAP